mmetsp:Transcript_30965/g.51304  ORF Transcript_30965/g.51304 Transcript_30965/m.51304 type:complete len:499 (+) Transcript_30965:35-1531(+)|eukprot:CAMPEP_0119320366 /NCGR_PEP_ID=MMETSP1333-20130426/52223_1 /TAXON_ID=418940 /ORGANISM="Scyphosphaera apsteinii, Strain RCC1455" /LENGTH=498 /DNA_ID=CAMNT_0007327073 /DNA_START=28 /DNA_END=1524 /DNA_ORIENTATION=-
MSAGPPSVTDEMTVQLAVTSAEQVLADPHNRDAILRPPLGEDMKMHQLCTAYIVDVRPSDGLPYSFPARFSRFERLHIELLKELPALRNLLPSLPQKHGPFAGLAKLLGQPMEPEHIEQRTRALDEWVKKVVTLPGVATSRALADLIYLGVGAESAIREAQAAFETTTASQTSRLDQLKAELKNESAYARACRQRKDRAELNALRLADVVDASVQLLSRKRQWTLLASVMRQWTGAWRAAREHKYTKQIETSRVAIANLEQRVHHTQQFAAEQKALALFAGRSLLDADEEFAALNAQLAAERAAFESSVRLHAAASRDAALAADREKQQVVERARAAEQLAAQRLLEVQTCLANSSALHAELKHADAAAAERDKAIEDARAVCEASLDRIATQRHKQAAASVCARVKQAASEARLLLLIQSQREQLIANAEELAEVRRLAATAQNRLELEAPWLGRSHSEDAPSEAEESKTDELDAQAQEVFVETWRREWMGAIAHGI